jgi:hypothetical protein
VTCEFVDSNKGGKKKTINVMKLRSKSFFLVTHILMIIVALCMSVKIGKT